MITQTNDDARSELTAQVEDLLNTLSNKFAGVSSEIFAKSRHSSQPPFPTSQTLTDLVDEMSRRLDNLEAQLKDNKDKKSGSN